MNFILIHRIVSCDGDAVTTEGVWLRPDAMIAVAGEKDGTEIILPGGVAFKVTESVAEVQCKIADAEAPRLHFNRYAATAMQTRPWTLVWKLAICLETVANLAVLAAVAKYLGAW
ncbi:MAG TPA: hypothetical protein VMY37_00900 [Thermoguttaceae bacterium]|nr:hypothetical protein [Thermoguttaceae bacterium]